VLVTDDEIKAAMRFLYARAKLACEPGAAAAVAAVLSGRVEGERICCVVSGGNVSAETTAAILVEQ
jgi:threonine dehydratase